MIELSKFVELNSAEEKVLGKVCPARRISTDTRSLLEGDIFLALSGESFDGNKYIEAAIEKGAKGIVYRTDNNLNIEELFTSFPEVFFIGVNNTEKYFQSLAKDHHTRWREGRRTVTIGITGSNGKTTTKELLSGLLEFLFPQKILFTKGNLNNHLGVPMTLLRLTPEEDVCILEMGTNHPGEIGFLCDLGDPDAGIITNIGQSHLEFFETEENVFKEKRTLFDYVTKRDGYFSVDGDNAFLKTLPANEKTVLSGFKTGNVKLKNNSTKLLISGDLELEVDCPLIFGIHNFKNLALSLSLILKLYPEKKEELKSACLKLELPKNNRSELIFRDDKIIYLDAYNANPSSMIASLETFKSYLNDKKLDLTQSCFVLGDMNELGEKSPEYHEEIGKLLNIMKIPNVLFVGRFCEFYKKGFGPSALSFESTKELQESWPSLFKKYSYFFLKGSRTLQLESLMTLN